MNELIFKLLPKQAQLVNSEATEILWGGAAGPGKSHGSRVASIAWCLEIPGLQVGLFRREYRDLIQNHMQGPTGFPAMLAPMVERKQCSVTEKAIEFPNGSKISLCHCQHEKDVFGWQGSEFHVLILEEATQFTEFQIRYLRSRVRMPDIMQIPEKWRGKFPRIVYPTNPGGVGHNYLKSALWEPAQALPEGATWTAPDDDGGFIRQFIPAKLTDNPKVNPEEYAKRLKGIGSDAYVRALLRGDWSVILGAYFGELSEAIHVLPDLVIPEHWFKFCWYDWGYGQPAACLWFATSDGDLCWTLEDEEVFLPRGAIVCYREMYLCNETNTARGARIDNPEQARRILALSGNEKISAYFSDSKPFQATGGRTAANPAAEMATEGLILKQGDTSNRVAAWSMVHSRLQAMPPMLYFTRSCKHTWRTLAALQTDPTKPEDADSDGEDHAPDCVKGACTVRRVVRDAAIPTQAQVKAAAVQRPTMGGILKRNGNGYFN